MTIARKISIDTRTMLTAMFAAALAVLVFSAAAPSAFAQAPAQDSAQHSANVVPQQGATKVQDDVRGVLTQYGRFVQHAKYGEVWIPTVTPQGWRPYPPCNWVNTRKYGWYYDDKTPWGAIVHHYGRWVSDAQMGWIWTPGAEFSPAWVVWRTSPEWVGWAPVLPDEDVKTVSTADFNSAAYWTFVETQKFAQGCNGAARPQQVPVLLTQTTYVTDIRLVYGITVIVLPGYVVGPWIDIDIFFSPWPAWFLAQNLVDWNFIWNNLAIMTAMAPDCPQVGPKQGGGPKPLPVHNPLPPLPPRPDKPIDHAPPVVVVVPPPPVCPRGTVMDHGVCRLPDFCRPGMVRVGSVCVFPTMPDPLPKPPVIDNPCANLSGIELRRCLHVHRPQGAGGKPPVLGPVPGTGDGRPAGHQTPPTGGQTGHNPNVRVKEPVQLPNRLPPPTSAPMRPSPNPAVMAPSGGLNKTTVGAAPQTVHRPMPVALPDKKPLMR